MLFGRKKKEKIKMCTCGRSIDDAMVYPKARYSLPAWLLVFLSYTARPRMIVYTCLKCGGEVSRITDRDQLEKNKDYAEMT